MMTSCNRCSKPSYFEMRYLGEHLCRKHFAEMFEKRARKTIRTNRLIGGADLVLVAVSGGKDSMTTLTLLADLLASNPRARVEAIHVDSGSPHYAADMRGIAENYCTSLDVPLHVYTFEDELGHTIDDIVEQSKGFDDPSKACTYCGVLRRRILNDKARDLGADVIATGHNLDDEIQAAMMNVVRGEVSQIGRIGPVVGAVKDQRFVARIKPLRNCPEDEVLAYANLKKIPYGKGGCQYSSASFRTSVKECINRLEENHPGSKHQLLKSTDELAAIMKERAKGAKIQECARCGEPASGSVCKACQILRQLKH